MGFNRAGRYPNDKKRNVRPQETNSSKWVLSLKIQIASDMHLEFTQMECELDPVAKVERDLLIVAGDVAEGTRGHNWLKNETEYGDPVVYVIGNHEYYGQDISYIDKYWEYDSNNIYNLQCRVWEYKGVRIAGCTLWTGFYGVSSYDKRLVEQSMADFHLIKKRGARFTPDISAGIHMYHRNWLKRQKDIDIVVTHHAPSRQSITPYWQEHGKHLNPAFAADCDDIIHELKPKYWIHGHMHSFMRYWHDRVVGGTQVICNPRGYVKPDKTQEHYGFSPKLIIEI